jgi:hypothetical protein
MPEGEVRGGVTHGEGGKFEDKYSDNDVVQALAEQYPEPLTNQEVADRVGCAKATAHNKLHALEDEGAVYTKKAGAKARVWWVDMTEPAPDGNGATIRSHIEGDRELVIAVASRFQPPFNPTRTGTDDMIDFIMAQPWGAVARALDAELRGEADGK